jgi:putative ubiquitin-RnfH superfamily antitoxin RatB of RatAB toxin-antitoxin module
MQRHNLKSLTLPIINNSLNISISIEYSFVKIDKVNIKNISEHTEIYDILNNYKYIYSINNIILEKIENDNKIEIIKNLLENKKEIDVECYILKNN